MPVDGACPTCRKAAGERYYRKHRTEVLAAQQAARAAARSAGRHRGKHLLRSYGITQAQKANMLQAQGGRCAICQCDRPSAANRNDWRVDHDHTTGVVRGTWGTRLC